MTTLMQASNQWATRPADERFTSLDDMQQHFDTVRDQSREVIVSSRRIEAAPTDESLNAGLVITGPNGHAYEPTHWGFGQLAQRAGIPAGWLRTQPAPLTSDILNYNLHYARNVEDIGVLLQRNGSNLLRAATGPNYGRIWNADVTRGLRRYVGDGVTGTWKVPGMFGKALDAVTKENTTLYASDQDMFVFLADEENRIEIPNRRNGQPGTLSRGFFIWNSEVGAATFGVGFFLFDYVCCNRIIWGAQDYQEIRIRHTASAPDRYLEEMAPALEAYATQASATVVNAIEASRQKRIDDAESWLGKRFGKRLAPALNAIHLAEEGRPVETVWDAVTAVTAHARSQKHQDARVALERQAGDLMQKAAA